MRAPGTQKIEMTNMCRMRAPTCMPVTSTLRIAGTARPASHRTRAPSAVRDTIDPAFEMSTLVRLCGLPSRIPMVPLRSSPAMEAAPIDRARDAMVRAP